MLFFSMFFVRAEAQLQESCSFASDDPGTALHKLPSADQLRTAELFYIADPGEGDCAVYIPISMRLDQLENHLALVDQVWQDTIEIPNDIKLMYLMLSIQLSEKINFYEDRLYISQCSDVRVARVTNSGIIQYNEVQFDRDPVQALWQILSIFLHEVGHRRLGHFADVIPYDHGSKGFNKEVYRRELQADSFMAENILARGGRLQDLVSCLNNSLQKEQAERTATHPGRAERIQHITEVATGRDHTRLDHGGRYAIVQFLSYLEMDLSEDEGVVKILLDEIMRLLPSTKDDELGLARHLMSKDYMDHLAMRLIEGVLRSYPDDPEAQVIADSIEARCEKSKGFVEFRHEHPGLPFSDQMVLYQGSKVASVDSIVRSKTHAENESDRLDMIAREMTDQPTADDIYYKFVYTDMIVDRLYHDMVPAAICEYVSRLEMVDDALKVDMGTRLRYLQLADALTDRDKDLVNLRVGIAIRMETPWVQSTEKLEYVRALTVRFPASAECWHLRAFEEGNGGDFVTASRSYEKAIGLEPDNLDYRGNLAYSYFMAKDCVKAVAQFTYVIEHAQEVSSDLFRLRCECYKALGKKIEPADRCDDRDLINR